MGIYERIKKVCEEKGFSINRLEKELIFPRSSISKYNTNSPSIEKIQAIAKHLNVTVDYLMNGEEPEPSVTVTDEDNNIIVLDDETLKLIDDLRSKPEMKMLFSVSRNATPEDIIKAVKIIEALKDDSQGR